MKEFLKDVIKRPTDTRRTRPTSTTSGQMSTTNIQTNG